jgi:rod shape-determining protein MreC
LFYQGAGPGLRALILVILSIALIVLDQRSSVFQSFHTQFFSRVAYPFQRMVDAPVRLMHWLNASVKSQSSLLDENAQLRAEQILLQARLQRLLTLQKENAQLRQLLQSTPQISGRIAVARLLAVGLDPNLEEVVLDKGSKDDVYRGQPVLDGFGVMGQVIGVGPKSIEISLEK